MKKDSLISVIVPVFNVSEYLDECVNSIINQKYTNLEIILVNDGSTDMSLDICRKWETLDNRVKTISKNNGGISSARNAGIEKSTGEYISFIDGDDLIADNFYSCLVQNMKETGSDVVICSYDRFLDGIGVPQLKGIEYLNTKTTVFEKKNIDFSKFINEYDFNLACNKVYKKYIFDSTRFPSDISYGEDLYVMSDIVEKVDKIAYVPQNFYFYRTRATSTSYTMNFQKAVDGIIVTRKTYNWSRKYNTNRKMFFNWCFGAFIRAYKQASSNEKILVHKNFRGFFIQEFFYSSRFTKCWLFIFIPKTYLRIIDFRNKTRRR